MGIQAEATAAAELWDRIIALARALRKEEGRLPTACPRWDVKDILAHLSGMQTAFDGSAPQPDLPPGWAAESHLSPLDAATEAGVVARRDWTIAKVVEELLLAKAGHVQRLSVADPNEQTMGPLGTTTWAKFYGVRMFDLWVHLQDIGVALGGKPDHHDASAAALDAARYVLDLVPFVAVKRAGLADGTRLRLEVNAPLASQHVIEVQDGRAAWAADDVDVADHIRVSPGTLTMLLAGRGAPESYRSQGVLEWTGPAADALVQRGRLFAA